jgi:hypothetical protein
MTFITTLSELSHHNMKEIWYNSSIIFEEYRTFFETSINSVLDDCGYEFTKRHLSGQNFLMYYDISIKCQPIEQLLSNEEWEKLSGKLYLGISLDEEKGNHITFYTWLELSDEYHQDFFHKNPKASKIKNDLQANDWEFEYNGDSWDLFKRIPIEKIDFSAHTWKKELKKFYDKCLTQISETILKIDK